jgi:hypothetical protein
VRALRTSDPAHRSRAARGPAIGALSRLRRGRPGRRGARHTCSLAPDIVPDQDPLEHRATPERSLDQRLDALSTANEVRTLRAQLKRDLKARKVSIGALLLDPPACLEAAKVFDMLLAVPKVGSVKATKILHGCRVSPSKTFGGLSERQRAELARAPGPGLTYMFSDGP